MAKGKPPEIQPLTSEQIKGAIELIDYLWETAARALESMTPNGELQETLFGVRKGAVETWKGQTKKFIENPRGVRILEPVVEITNTEILIPSNDPSTDDIKPLRLFFGGVRVILDDDWNKLLPKTVRGGRPQTRVLFRALFPSSKTTLEKIRPELAAEKEELDYARSAGSTSRKTRRAARFAKAIGQAENTATAAVELIGRTASYNPASGAVEAYNLIAAGMRAKVDGGAQITVKRLLVGQKNALLVDSRKENPWEKQMEALAAAMNFVEEQLLGNGENQPGTTNRLAGSIGKKRKK